MIDFFVFAAIGYVLGSLPFGLIAGRLFSGVDVRDHGSGKTGMTNVLRTVGVRAAVAVLLLDMGKALLAIYLARFFTGNASVEVTAGLGALIGHNWPVFTRFKGGRGTATGWASLFILEPISGLIATVIGIPAIAITRYVSLGSLLGATCGALSLVIIAALGYADTAYIWFGVIAGIIVVGRHRDNIARLLKGEERKLGQKA